MTAPDPEPEDEPQYPVQFPGEFSNWFRTTRIAEGHYATPQEAEAFLAWDSAVHKAWGLGSATFLIGNRTALTTIRDTAQTRLDRKPRAMSHGDERGCKRAVERINAALNPPPPPPAEPTDDEETEPKEETP